MNHKISSHQLGMGGREFLGESSDFCCDFKGINQVEPKTPYSDL